MTPNLSALFFIFSSRTTELVPGLVVTLGEEEAVAAAEPLAAEAPNLKERCSLGNLKV